MPYQYLDHTADLGIRATGATLEQAFDEGAQAMLMAMADTSTIKGRHGYHVVCSAPDVASLFVEWLNELLYQREVNQVLLSYTRVTHLEQAGQEWTLTGVAYGEPIDLARHTPHTEIKAATYAGLCYIRDGEQHVLQCVLDL
jgi:tRNA nucleotidyltransferase (CCA-adding enzyme)